MRSLQNSSDGAAIVTRDGERGSALVLATLITVIMSLLGISYLMMAQTESTIAENERNAAMALYVAEAGTRLTVAWLNDQLNKGKPEDEVTGAVSGRVDLVVKNLSFPNGLTGLCVECENEVVVAGIDDIEASDASAENTRIWPTRLTRTGATKEPMKMPMK